MPAWRRRLVHMGARLGGAYATTACRIALEARHGWHMVDGVRLHGWATVKGDRPEWLGASARAVCVSQAKRWPLQLEFARCV